MELNLIKYQYNCVTYSSETILSDLNAIHTVKDPLEWNPNTGTSQEWIKVNFYYLNEISKINLSWSGSCASFKIEYSLDNFNWEVLSDTWVPDSTTLSIDYSSNLKKLVYVKFIVNSPVSFVLEDFDVFSDIVWENEDIISHNYFRAYGINFREKYPVIPSIIQDTFKMMENYNNLDKTLYDKTPYESTVVSCVNISGVGQLSVSNLTLDTSLQYIWDYDDINTIYEEGTDGIVTDIAIDDNKFLTDIDLSDYSIDEFVDKYLVVVSGMNMGSYKILSNTNNSSGNEIITDIGEEFLYSLTNMRFKIQDISETQLIENPNIIVTTDPTINPVDHEYINVGIYYPRLLVISQKYILEFNTSITIT